MPANSFEAVVRRGAGIPIIDLRGEIDALAENALNAAYCRASEDKPAAVLLNFGAVDYINSTGIALIVGLLAKARPDGCRLLTCGLKEHFVEIFKITRLADFLDIFGDEPSAVAAATMLGTA